MATSFNRTPTGRKLTSQEQSNRALTGYHGRVNAILPAVFLFAPQWAPLFNGHDLTGWKQEGGTAAYRAESGEIIGESRPNTVNSFLCTTRPYGDFELEFEFKIDQGLNSGIQFRSNSFRDYQNFRVHGYQYELNSLDPATFGGLYDEARKGWLQKPSGDVATRAYKPNAWNKGRLVCSGDTFQTWLNGKKTAETKDRTAIDGFIALQIHEVGARTEPLRARWRNLRVKDYGTYGGVPRNQAPAGALGWLQGPSDLAQWTKRREPGAPIGWEWRGSWLEGKPGTGDIVTRQVHESGFLHLEFSVDENGKTGQENGNSGVYLQSRFEVQILNSNGEQPSLDNCAAIYSIKAADFAVTRPAGEWQTYDIWFTAPKYDGETKVSDAVVTVYHNGILVHDKVVVPRPTAAGADQGKNPLGLLIQDHGHAIRFRNIWWQPAK